MRLITYVAHYKKVKAHYEKVFFLIFLQVFEYNCYAASPIPQIHRELKAYYEQGHFYDEVDQILTEAFSKIKKITPSDNAIIIFDIDDTALSHHDYYILKGFTVGDYQSWSHWISMQISPAIEPVLIFYKMCLDLGFKVIFMSCREDEFYNSTYEHLMKLGYSRFEKIILRTPQDRHTPFTEYKQNKRKELIKQGYEVIACIGDQWSDLEGNHTGIKYLTISGNIKLLKERLNLCIFVSFF